MGDVAIALGQGVHQPLHVPHPRFPVLPALFGARQVLQVLHLPPRGDQGRFVEPLIGHLGVAVRFPAQHGHHVEPGQVQPQGQLVQLRAQVLQLRSGGAGSGTPSSTLDDGDARQHQRLRPSPERQRHRPEDPGGVLGAGLLVVVLHDPPQVLQLVGHQISRGEVRAFGRHRTPEGLGVGEGVGAQPGIHPGADLPGQRAADRPGTVGEDPDRHHRLALHHLAGHRIQQLGILDGDVGLDLLVGLQHVPVVDLHAALAGGPALGVLLDVGVVGVVVDGQHRHDQVQLIGQQGTIVGVTHRPVHRVAHVVQRDLGGAQRAALGLLVGGRHQIQIAVDAQAVQGLVPHQGAPVAGVGIGIGDGDPPGDEPHRQRRHDAQPDADFRRGADRFAHAGARGGGIRTQRPESGFAHR